MRRSLSREKEPAAKAGFFVGAFFAGPKAHAATGVPGRKSSDPSLLERQHQWHEPADPGGKRREPFDELRTSKLPHSNVRASTSFELGHAGELLRDRKAMALADRRSLFLAAETVDDDQHFVRAWSRVAAQRAIVYVQGQPAIAHHAPQ